MMVDMGGADSWDGIFVGISVGTGNGCGKGTFAGLDVRGCLKSVDVASRDSGSEG